MRPILFDASESVFTSNGLGRLSDCISCFVEEERNGKYELEMEYPVSGDHFAEILHSRFVYAVPADGKEPQPFRIYAITKPIGGVCTIYAEHISYQLFHIPLNPFLPEASITRAFQAIKANAAEDCPFEFSTDKTTVANFKVDEPKSIREVLYGSEGSILDVYGGGEYEWDRYNVILHQHRGTDRGVVLRYGKDITDLTQEENIENTITGVYPFWKGQNDEQEDVLVTLPEKVVHSANAGNFPYKRTVTLDCSAEFDNVPTVAQLRAYANNYISQNNIGVPDVSITVKFAPLWQTEEYKDIANLERVNLCDTVTVHYEKLGVDATAKVIRTKYDVLNERYEEIELGSAKSSVASVIRGDIQSAIETAAKRSTEIENKLHVEITENTRKITGGLGGHVVLKLNADGEPEEILIMDTDDVTTAVNVWRFNMGGLGHSHSGYNGPFDDIALTMDGHINANMITVGTLNANLIKAGVLSDSQGINYIDMETGEMRIGASASLGGSTIAQHKANAVSTANRYTDAQLADYKDTVDAVVSNLQSQIDGQVMTWYYDYEPTMQNAPASGWNTAELRQQHEGDVFYWKSKGYAYRFMQSGSTWGWTLIQDTDITAAIAKAENAQDTADHKRRVFVTQPVPPYDIGDLWTQGSSGDLYRCETARASGNYVAGDWKKATKYTDDSTFTAFRDGTYATFVTNTNSAIGGKITTYYQTSQPTAKATGDLWIDTDDGNKLYRWNGSQWKSVQDSAIQTAITAAGDAQATADSKIITFAQASQPTATDVGDLWIDTDDANKMYRWNGTAWVQYTDSSAVDALEIGGRNIILDTGASQTATASTATGTSGVYRGNTSTRIFSDFATDRAASGDTITVSFDYKLANNSYSGAYIGPNICKSGSTSYYSGNLDTEYILEDDPTVTTSGHYSCTAKLTSNQAPPYRIGVWVFASQDARLTISNFKVEFGSKETSWTPAPEDVDKAIQALDTALDQEEIFNRLTDNGATQGIYMQNGRLYLNATYMQTGTMSAARIQGGTLKLGGSNNTNGLLEVYDASGTKIGSWGKDGLFANTGGKITSKDGSVYFDLDNNELTCNYLRGKTGSVPYWVDKDTYYSGRVTSQEIYVGDKSIVMRVGGTSTGINMYPTGARTGDNWIREISSKAGIRIANGVDNGASIDVKSDGDIWLSGGSSSSNLTAVYIDSSGTHLPEQTYALRSGYERKVAVESSSSVRYKNSIKPIGDANLDPHKLLSLPIVQFAWNEDAPLQYDDMRGQTVPGIIAEDVEEIYPAATIHDTEGRVESWDERRLIPGMLALIQEQDKKIKQLEARLAKIEEMLI